MKFRITCPPLPATFRGTSQQFLDFLVEGMEITSDASGFSTSATMPEGNVGPWFKNGMEPYVWDEETSTYVLLDLSSSIPPQITAQETAPDPTVFPLWLKLSGTTVLGLFTFFEGSWVSEPGVLDSLSVSTELWADGAITGRKFAPQAVTPEKLSSNVEFNLWEDGPAGWFLRTDPNGERPAYRSVTQVADDVPLTESPTLSNFPHSQGVPPTTVQVVFVNGSDVAVGGMEPGEGFAVPHYVIGMSGASITADNTDIRFNGNAFSMWTDLNGSLHVEYPTWAKVRVYYSAA
jgi:hypothetical protein